MKNLNCVIVDDEPLAQDLIEKFIDRVPYLTLQEKYDNAIEAIDGISNDGTDIVFLDVNMPEMSGIELLKCLTIKRPHVILTTAHPDYALEGFELNVVDYLLKPVSFSRFMKAINKVKERMPSIQDFEKEVIITKGVAQIPENQNSIEKENHRNDKFFLIKADKKLLKVDIEDIVFVEGMKDYVKIHLQKSYIITHITMTKILELLPTSLFIRINRSFIVQINCIKCIEGNMVETTNGHKLTIGSNYREEIRNTAKGWTI